MLYILHAKYCIDADANSLNGKFSKFGGYSHILAFIVNLATWWLVNKLAQLIATQNLSKKERKI